MRAAVWYGPKDVRIEEVPVPTAGPGRVRIKVRWCAICGSDLHEYLAGPVLIPKRRHPLTGKLPPIILGHEFAGDVVETGAGVTNISVGDRATINACLWCHECYWCLRGEYNLCAKLGSTGLCDDGGFAEYVSVPAYACHRLPDAITEEMGTFVEPLAVAAHACRRSRLGIGDTALVVGAGPIGLLMVQVLRSAGAREVYVVEKLEQRRRLAMELGAKAAFDPGDGDAGKWMDGLTAGVRADVAFDCVGNQPAVETAVKASKKGGTVVIVGIHPQPISFDFGRMVAHEKTFIGSSAYTDEYPLALSLLADRRVVVEPLITGRVELADLVRKGFDVLVERPGEQVKIIVRP